MKRSNKPRTRKLASTKLVERQLEIDGRSLPVVIRLDSRARRIAVRVDPTRAQITVTSPPRAGIERAMGFAATQGNWILKRLERVPVAVPFADGAVIPLGGAKFRIEHRPDLRGNVWIEGHKIHVAGPREHLARRLRDWLKDYARKRIFERVGEYAQAIRVKPARIQIRDTVTRWGSCSPSGALSFSWRLILAPEHVLDYVAAHEVCHLKHLDHSKRFWNLCESLVGDSDEPRAWLRIHGARLHRYGQSDEKPAF